MKPKNQGDINKGYSLVELVVVLAGLSILTTISLRGTSGNNGILSWKKRADIDGTKALLNSTAADCLQKSRVSSDTIVDDSIISNEVLESKGYIIDPENKTCTSFGVKPINDAEALLFPMSFAIVSGNLTKSSQPTGPDSISYCKSWAGILCTEGEELKKLVNHMAAIQTSKDECDTKLAEKKAAKMTGGPVDKWNPNATKDCPTRPPVDPTSKTCTISGCLNNPVWLVEGVEYTSQADADAAETAIAGENCITNLNNLTKANPTLTQAKVRPEDCKKDYYFAGGKRFDNETAWETEMCSKNKKELLSSIHSGPVEYCKTSPIYICGGKEIVGANAKANYEICLENDKNALCTTALNNDAVGRTGGPHTSPTPDGMSAPIGDDCGVKYWYCVDKIYKDETKYKNDDRCKAPSCGNPPVDECDSPAYYDHWKCASYNRCLGRIE